MVLKPFPGLVFFEIHDSSVAAVMMTSWYRIAISAVAFWCMIAVIAPFALHLAFIVLLWAEACWSNSVVLITDAISWSIVLGSGTLLSLLMIKRLSAMLEPVIGAGAGLAGFIWFRGGIISHHLFSVGAADIAPFHADVVLGVGVGAGLTAGAGFGLGVGFGFGFGFGIGTE